MVLPFRIWWLPGTERFCGAVFQQLHSDIHVTPLLILTAVVNGAPLLHGLRLSLGQYSHPLQLLQALDHDDTVAADDLQTGMHRKCGG